MNPSSDTLLTLYCIERFQKLAASSIPTPLGQQVGHRQELICRQWARPTLTPLWQCPLCALLTQEEIDRGYEAETGNVIVETFQERGIQPLEIPGVLLQGHGPFTWGKDAQSAVMNAVVLEEVAKMNVVTRQINSYAPELPQRILTSIIYENMAKMPTMGKNNQEGADNMLAISKKNFGSL